MRTSFSTVAILTLLTVSSAIGQEITREKLTEAVPKFTKLADEALQTTGVPGMAIAVVHEDRVVMLQGFGVRKAGEPAKVDADTVFQLASVSKPITTTILARLVGDGLIRWDDRISDLDPDFQLSDPWVTRHLTLRDLLSHRSGLPDHAGDLLEDLGYDRGEILHRLRFLRLGRFRDQYAYTNFGFTEAAVAAARKTGKSWEELAADRLFRPLGMNSTSARFRDYEASKNRAVAHVKVGDHWVAKYTRQPDAQSPAGGVSSTVRDLVPWMQLQLNSGKYDGRQLIDADALAATHQPVIFNGMNGLTKRPHFYGLGWMVQWDEHGVESWDHSGGFDLGIRTQVYLLPADKLGIAVLTNAGPNGLPEAVTMSFLDIIRRGQPSRDWVALANRAFAAATVPNYGAGENYAKPPEKPSPVLPFETYVGKYKNDYFGPAEIVVANEGLILKLGPKHESYPIRHWDRDVFFYQPSGESAAGSASLTFRVGVDRKADTMTIENLNVAGLGTFTRSSK